MQLLPKCQVVDHVHMLLFFFGLLFPCLLFLSLLVCLPHSYFPPFPSCFPFMYFCVSCVPFPCFVFAVAFPADDGHCYVSDFVACIHQFQVFHFPLFYVFHSPGLLFSKRYYLGSSSSLSFPCFCSPIIFFGTILFYPC